MSAKVSATRGGEPPSVTNLFCQAELQESTATAPATAAESGLAVGTKVVWKIRAGQLIPGTIERDNGDGTYDIAWTYGGSERMEKRQRGMRVEKGRIQPAPDTSEWRKKLDAGVKDLKGADLRFLELKDFDFLGYDLTDARLDGCNLKHCVFGLRDLTRLQPIVFGAVIVGNMGGMFLPGLMHDVYGTYCASLLMSFGATLVTMCCFVTMFFQHPFGTTPPRDTVEGARGTTVPTASSSGPSVDAMPPPQRFSRKVGRWWKGIVDGGRGPAREILM